MHDIILARLNAHLSYLAPRLVGEKRKVEFIGAMNIIIGNIRDIQSDYLLGIGMCRKGGISLAKDITEDIIRNTELRFGHAGRTGDFMLERL